MEQKRYRILMFVEDEPDLIELYRFAFESAGFIIQSVGTGEEAMEIIQKLLKEEKEIEPPNAIILDILLPGISGMDILRELRKYPKFNKIPIIIFTNYSNPEYMKEVSQTENTEYVLKTDATPDQLVEIVRNKIKEVEEKYTNVQ